MGSEGSAVKPLWEKPTKICRMMGTNITRGAMYH